jgi:hypothetical protein
LTVSIAHLCREPKLRALLAAQGKHDVAANFSAVRYLTELERFYQVIGPTGADFKLKVVPAETTIREADPAKFA